jgi:hypothetical protein
LGSPADLIDQVYTITDDSHPNYKTAAWTITPDYCEVDFVSTITPLNGVEGTAVDVLDGEVFSALGEITFDFDYSKDLLPATTSETQTVTITGTSKSKYGTNNAITLDVDFDVTFLNPCLDPNFVQIVKGDLDELTYVILSGAAQVQTHPLFTVTTTPITHDLCGDLEYATTYDGSPVGATDKPFAYSDPSTQEITIDSDDTLLID